MLPQKLFVAILLELLIYGFFIFLTGIIVKCILDSCLLVY